MIRNLSFTKASAIYQHLSDHNKNAFAAAKQNTPVSTLVDPVIAPALFYDDQSDDYKSVNSITSMIERNAQHQTGNGTDTYDLTLSNFVSLASEAIRRTVYLTKTVALPTIEDITLQSEARLNEVTGGLGLALNIVPDTQASVLVNPTLVEAIRPFESVAGPDTETVNVHDPRDSAQLVEIMRVGYDDFDKEMEAWMAAHVSSEIVSSIYNRVFSSGSNTVHISSVFGASADSYPEALICFLIARGLMQNPDDNINMTASKYDMGMAFISNYSAMVIKRGMNSFDSADKHDRIVLRYPAPGQELSFDRPEQGIIVVNKPAYDRYLEQGGTPEAIMGSYLLDRKTHSEDLMQDRDGYVKTYNARILKVRSDSRLRAILSLRKHIERLVSHEISRTLPETSEKGVWGGIDINQAAAQLRLRAAVERLRLEDLDDMYGAVRNIVLDVFFIDTDVAKLIELIDANSKDSPEDIKSAVNVAIVDYIVDWFMHQTTVENH